MSGTVPAADLAALTSLEQLVIQFIPISGSLPGSSIAALTGLKILKIQDTKLSATLPAAIFQLTRIVQL